MWAYILWPNPQQMYKNTSDPPLFQQQCSPTYLHCFLVAAPSVWRLSIFTSVGCLYSELTSEFRKFCTSPGGSWTNVGSARHAIRWPPGRQDKSLEKCSCLIYWRPSLDVATFSEAHNATWRRCAVQLIIVGKHDTIKANRQVEVKFHTQAPSLTL